MVGTWSGKEGERETERRPRGPAQRDHTHRQPNWRPPSILPGSIDRVSPPESAGARSRVWQAGQRGDWVRPTAAFLATAGIFPLLDGRCIERNRKDWERGRSTEPGRNPTKTWQNDLFLTETKSFFEFYGQDKRCGSLQFCYKAGNRSIKLSNEKTRYIVCFKWKLPGERLLKSSLQDQLGETDFSTVFFDQEAYKINCLSDWKARRDLSLQWEVIGPGVRYICFITWL